MSFSLRNMHGTAQVSISSDQEQTYSSQGIPSSSNQTQSSSTHPNVEQVWAAFAPSSTPQVIWPVRANHQSSTRSNRKISNLPTTDLGLNNQTAKAESSSTCSDESDGDDDSDDELIELIGLYQTRYSAAQKHKVPRSEQKKKIAIIRRNSFLQGNEKYRTNLHVNGASQLRRAADFPNETLRFSPAMVLKKAKNQVQDVIKGCSKFFGAQGVRNIKKVKYHHRTPFSPSPKLRQTPRGPLERMTRPGARANRSFETSMSPTQIHLPLISSAPLPPVEELLPLPDSKAWYY